MIANPSTWTDRYVAMWNEPDPQARQVIVVELWADDATNFTQSVEARGLDEIEARVTRAHDSFVGSGTYEFRAARVAATHHNAIRLDWEMVARDDGKIASVGTEFIILNDEGRIVSDHQFLET